MENPCLARSISNESSHIVRIICLGNLLHGDDGVGFHVFNALSLSDLPDNVEIIDGRTAGLALIPMFKHCHQVVLVDLIKIDKADNKKLGDVLVLEDVGNQLNSPNFNFEHGGSLTELVAMLDVYLHEKPTVDFVGVFGTDTEAFKASLTPALHSSINQIVARILEITHCI